MHNNDFRGFDAVWQRVQAPSCPLPHAIPAVQDAGAAPLESFIDRETAIAAAYSALAARWQKAFCSAAFHRAAKNSALRIRRLETAYFIAVGDSWAPKVSGRADTGMPEALRTLWLAHRSLALAYDQAAQSAGEELNRLFLSMAIQHRRQMDTLSGIIQHFMK